MTYKEACKILAILKAAYPNSYRNLDKAEAESIAKVWAAQFGNIPYIAVTIAVQKLISTNTFPPTINEVKSRIRSLYWEAGEMIRKHKLATEGMPVKNHPTRQIIYWDAEYKLDPQTLAAAEEILRVCEPMRTQQQIEPTLAELLSGFNNHLGINSDKTALIEKK